MTDIVKAMKSAKKDDKGFFSADSLREAFRAEGLNEFLFGNSALKKLVDGFQASPK